MPRSEITIKVRAREDFVPVGSFLTIVSNTLSILRSLDHIVRRSKKAAEWKVSAASLQSPLTLTISSDDPQSENLAREYLGTFEAIEKSSEIQKDRIPFTVLEQAKALVSVLNDGVAQIGFSTPGSAVVYPTQRVAANVDYLTAAAYEDFSTIEGKIETLSVHGRTLFRIYEDLTGFSVVCYFKAEQLDEAHGAFNKRVAVSGITKYSRMGRPISVQVEAIRKLIGGIRVEELNDIDLTGGVPSEEYIRRMRDAE
jgi:hypothetical protein